VNDLTFAQTMTISPMPVVNAVRRFFLRIELRDTEYTLAHIAATRRNDFLVEKEAHKRQVMLQSKLRQLETK
jgi:hypothetical protein